MVLEKKNRFEVHLKEFNTLDYKDISGLSESASIAQDKDLSSRTILKLLEFINVQATMDCDKPKGYYLMWLKENTIIGFMSLTEIIEGKRAQIKFSLLEEASLTADELKESIRSSVNKVFKKFNLKRLVSSVNKNNLVEQQLIQLYPSYPIGFVNLEQSHRHYVITKENTPSYYGSYNLLF